MNVIVVGAGNMGRHHARVYSEIASVKEVRVVDSNPEALKQFGGSAKAKCFSSLEGALAEGEAHAASVVVPTHLHYEVGKKVIEAGLPTLLEKPLCDSIEKGVELKALAEEKGVLLMPGHLERFNPAITELKNNLGMLGELVYASTHRYGIPSNRKLGDALYDLAVHDVDLLSYLTGKKPVSVSAIERDWLKLGSNDLCSCVFEFEGGFTASVEANRVSPIKVRELSLVGREGVARVDYTRQSLSIFKLDEIPKEYHAYKTFNELVTHAGQGNELKVFIKKGEPLRAELEHFLACAKGEAVPFVTATDGLYALAAVQAGAAAAKSNKKEEIKW